MTVPAVPLATQSSVPPAAPPAKVKLPFWTYVKESYGELKHMGAIVKAGWASIAIQIAIMLVVVHLMQQLLVKAAEIEAMGKNVDPAVAAGIFPILMMFMLIAIAAGLLFLSFRSALYRWQLKGGPIPFINPLYFGAEEWRMVWYQIKSIWFMIWPWFCMFLFLCATGGLVFGGMGMLYTGASQKGIDLMIIGAVMLIPVMICSIWVLRRQVELTVAFPGIFDDAPQPRMWKDVWHWTKGYRWAIFWGMMFVPLEMFSWLLSQLFGNGREGELQQTIALFETYPVQVRLGALALTLLWYLVLVARIAFETRCYRFVKANPGAPLKS
jgi:hypothetical protein